MDPDRWNRLRDRFEHLVDLGGVERERALRDLEREDPDLAEEVRAWLDADHLEQSPLEQGAPSLAGLGPPPVIPGAEAWVGRVLGAYRIVESVAEGGQGLVFLGERADGSFRRRVAIKVAHGSLGSGPGDPWLRVEREVLAQLDHPNIVRLLDAGEVDDGFGTPRSFLVLEHVEDTDFARTWSALDRRTCLEVMLALGAAVQHAHGRGVVHGDLKPANIGFDEVGGVKLFDFGIARRIESVGSTERGAGTVAMTPAYASPEQLRGEPSTTSSDVHALGLLLFEGLVGRRVRDVVDPGGRVPRPSDRVEGRRARRALRGDLDAICMRALEPNPEERYESAAHLTADLRAHLERRPVLARGNRWRDHLRCFIHRQRLATAAISVAVLATFAVFLAVFVAYMAGFYHLNAMRVSRDAARHVEGVLAKGLIAGLDSPERRSAWIGRTLEALETLEEGPEASARLRLHLAEVLILEGRIGEARAQWDLALGELERVRDLDPYELDGARDERERRFGAGSGD